MHRIASNPASNVWGRWMQMNAGANRRDFSAFVAQRTNNFRLSRTNAACATIARDNARTTPDAIYRTIPATRDNAGGRPHAHAAIIGFQDSPSIAIAHQLKSF